MSDTTFVVPAFILIMAKTEINAETNLSVKKTRKSPVPVNYERIVAGALNLKLKEKVDLRNALSSSIEKELAQMEQSLTDAKALLNGK